MRKPITVLSALLLCLQLAAQKNPKDVPDFGNVEKPDLEMKNCDFDNNAEAMVLFDVAELYCSITHTGVYLDLERHVRIKILKDKGRDQSDIHIKYYSYAGSGLETIKNLTAQTYNLDASGNIVVTKVEKKQIFEKKLNKKYSEQVFTFPEVKAGSIIEFKYKHTNTDFVNWYFQRAIPVRYSRYRIDFPNEIEMRAAPLCSLPYDAKRDQKSTREIQHFSMKDIPALRDEPYISSPDDYLQRIEIRPIAINSPLQRINLQRSWPGIVRSLMQDEDFGEQLKRNIPRTADLDEALKPLKDPYSKMVTIHNYVKKNMEWNGYTSIWAFDGVRSAWKDKKGTNGEINLILVNLLKDAGLSASPILVRTHENGMVDITNPNTTQFDKVMAYVTIGERVYVLDATDKYTPPNLIPSDVMFSEGLMIEKFETFEWGWKTLWNEKQQYKDVILINAVIDEEGKMKGNAIITSYDYARAAKMPYASQGTDKFKEKYFTAANQPVSVDSLSFENDKNDSLPLVQKLGFSMPVNSSGDYKYFSTNLFSGLEKNPFLADNRFSDVFFGTNQSYSIIANVTIPDGYAFEALPKNLRMIMPDTSISITRRVASDKKQLSMRLSLEFKKPFFPVTEYPDFKEFYKKLFDLLNEQIAIRKETNP